ncbi:MAG: hypothetical protein HY897_25095 [Deltaproteobacteria bacterium]|nr:hypothetical protein [Deltaproteobacteria bacterium]
MIPFPRFGKPTFICALAIVVSTGVADADAEREIVLPKPPLDLESLSRCYDALNRLIARFKERQIDERVFRNSLKREACWQFADIRSGYYTAVVRDDKERTIVDVLKRGAAECDLDPSERYMHARGDEEILRALCEGAIRLSRINIKTMDEVIDATKNNCRDVFIVCKDLETHQFTERELEELAKETEWGVVREYVENRLNELRGTVDLSEAIRMRQLVEEDQKAREHRRQNVETRDGGKEPSGTPEEKRGTTGGGKDGGGDAGDAGRPQEHGVKKDEGAGRKTVWVLAGAGVTIAIVALLAARTLRKK